MSEHKTNRKKLGAKLLSLTLSAAMVLSMFPTAFASAAEEAQEPPAPTTTTTVKSFSKLNDRFTQSATQEHVYSLAVKLDTPFEELKLPEKLEVKVEEVKDSGGVQYSKEIKTEKVAVTWDGDKEYTSDENGTFIYTAELPKGYNLASGVELPQIYVYVGKQARGAAVKVAEVNTAEAFRKAFTNEAAGTTIKVTADIDLGDKGAVSDGKSFNLDLNGKTVKFNRSGETFGTAFLIKLSGKAGISIIDSSPDKSGKLSATGDGCMIISNGTEGSITIESGTLEAEGGINSWSKAGVSAISNSGSGNVTISGGLIQATGKEGKAIANGDTGTVTIKGGTVRATDASSLAIHNYSTGKIIISGTDTLVTSKITDNTKGTIYIAEVPEATAADKIILDVQGGTVSNTASPENYSVYYADTDVTGETVANYLSWADGTVGTIYPELKVTGVAAIGFTGYETLAAAVAAAEDGNTIKILADIDLGKEGISFRDKALTLDLNGKTVKSSGEGSTTAIKLSGSGSLTITDTSSKGEGILESTGARAFLIGASDTGTVTIKGGTVQATGEAGRAINNNTEGATTIEGGTVRATSPYGIAISSYGTGAVTIKGGTVQATGEAGRAIINNTEGATTIEGGTVKATSPYGIAIGSSGTGTVTVSGGIVEAEGDLGKAIYSKSTGAVTVSGGTVSTGSNSGAAISNSSTGTITISGTALVTSKNAETTAGTIYLNLVPSPASVILDIQGGTVSNTASPEGYSVYFCDKSITFDNLSSYYAKASEATVGKIYPEKKAPSGGGGSSSSDSDTSAPVTKPATPDKGIVVDDNSGAKDILDPAKNNPVDVKIYSGTSNSDIVPDAKIFSDIKSSGKTVEMPVKDVNNNELYSITINGDWMKNAPVQVNSMNFGAAVTKTAQGTEFSMRHTGFVPGGMVKVGLPGFTAGTQQYVYAIDAATGARVEIALTAADASGKVNFYAADGGKYVVSSARDTARYGAVSDTRAPVGVAKGGEYTFKFTVENGQEAKFSVGNSRFTNTALRKVGSSYYLTVTPNGTASTGDMTGIYCTLSDGRAVKMGTAVAK